MATPKTAFLVILAFLPLRVIAQDSVRAKVDAVFAAYDKPGSPGCALGVIGDGRFVYVKCKGTPKKALQPTYKDIFTSEGVQFEFNRDGRGRIGGLAVQAGRIRNVRFDKGSRLRY